MVVLLLTLLSLGSLSSAASLLVVSWRARRSASALGQARHVPISDAAVGTLVRLEGWAMAAGPMALAPLSQTECLWCSWSVDREDEQHDGNGDYINKERGATRAPFAIGDLAGALVRVLPAKAEAVKLGERREWFGMTPRPEPAGTGFYDRPLLERLKLGKYRYTELRLMPGAPLFVIGLLEAPHPEDGAGVRGRISQGGGVQFLMCGEAPDATQVTLQGDAVMAFRVGIVLAVLGLVSGYFALG